MRQLDWPGPLTIISTTNCVIRNYLLHRLEENGPLWTLPKSIGCLAISKLIDRLFDVFFAKVHSWYPFLDPPSCKKCYAGYEKMRPEFSSTYCLFLLIMALGTMAEDENARGRNWAEKYAQPAFAMLSPVMISNDLVSAQCLILLAYTDFSSSTDSRIYFMWLIKPTQAWNFICYASNKIQNLLYWYISGTIGLLQEDANQWIVRDPGRTRTRETRVLGHLHHRKVILAPSDLSVQ